MLIISMHPHPSFPLSPTWLRRRTARDRNAQHATHPRRRTTHAVCPAGERVGGGAAADVGRDGDLRLHLQLPCLDVAAGVHGAGGRGHAAVAGDGVGEEGEGAEGEEVEAHGGGADAGSPCARPRSIL
jgi:hypothetical protein